MPKVRQLVKNRASPETIVFGLQVTYLFCCPHLPLVKENLSLVIFQVLSVSPEDFVTTRSASRGYNLWDLRCNIFYSALCTSIVSLSFSLASFTSMKAVSSICGPGLASYGF